NEEGFFFSARGHRPLD
nr:Chain C, fibrinopeptide B [synthetic construct]1R17_D Chain D, fibrinopeptide B [synthetic construct]